MELGKYSIGTGDRFGRQGDAQLKAIMDARGRGVDLSIVWNKSNREHEIIGTSPADVRTEADEAVRRADWKGQYLVDADHINIDTVEPFIEHSDFFTLDVASYIGVKAGEKDIEDFVGRNQKYIGRLEIAGPEQDIIIDKEFLVSAAEQYLCAIRKAKDIYSFIVSRKGAGNFITEVSMDEVELPQTPADLFFILEMIAHEYIPVSTIAPKFPGRFNKGVDYAGDKKQFAAEFEADILVIGHAIREFGLNPDLKLSVHSGSDKFSIYPLIRELIHKHDAGIHIKTAGTTWLEEVIGLALSENEALDFVKNVYSKALEKIDELCAPYADVIDIDRDKLPVPVEVIGWDGERFAASLRHISGNEHYNSSMRQLIHVAYKLAAKDIKNYYRLLDNNKEEVSRCVYENLFERHIGKLFNIL